MLDPATADSEDWVIAYKKKELTEEDAAKMKALIEKHPELDAIQIPCEVEPPRYPFQRQPWRQRRQERNFSRKNNYREKNRGFQGKERYWEKRRDYSKSEKLQQWNVKSDVKKEKLQQWNVKSDVKKEKSQQWFFGHTLNEKAEHQQKVAAVGNKVYGSRKKTENPVPFFNSEKKDNYKKYKV